MRGRTDLHALLEARDADLEELVEVGAADAQEAQPLEQRHVGIACLLEYPPVELEQAEFAIDVEVVHSEVQRQQVYCLGEPRSG